MPRPLFITTLISLTLFFLSICNVFSLSRLNSLESNNLELLGKRVCTKNAEDCFPGEEEMEMESESSRRLLLMQKKYISYETLKRDMVPCDRPGVSYYACHSRQANSYSRGCEVITRCRNGNNT